MPKQGERSVSTQRVLQRGLTEYEVAIIKRMRMMNLRRDYIFSFILEPGRVLTPACVAEIEQGKIGRDVDPASAREVEVFVARRLLLSGGFRDSSYTSPISANRVRQVLRWFEPGQLELLPSESQVVEYKMYFKTDEKSLIGYAKALAAFANNSGGYLIFGVSDDRKPCQFDEDKFRTFDWQRFQEIIDDFFGVGIAWHQDLVEDADLKLGVVFAAKSRDSIVICEKSGGAGVEEGAIYYRYSGETRRIKPRDLRRLMIERASASATDSEEEAIAKARQHMEDSHRFRSARDRTLDLFDSAGGSH